MDLFGKKAISKAKSEAERYTRLYEDALREVEVLRKAQADNFKTIKTLTNSINSEAEKVCKLGPWCNQCKYRRVAKMYDAKPDTFFESVYFYESGSDLAYCAKHLKDICPEYERGEK